MIDISFVQTQYARMTDDALEHFATNEASQLTSESFRLLKAELEKRSLDINFLQFAETNDALFRLDNQTHAEKVITKSFTTSLWNYALTEKENGTSDIDIYNGLIRKGVSESGAFNMVQNLAIKSKELIGNYDTSIIISRIFFFTGIILFILVSNRTLPVTFGMAGLLLLILAAVLGLKNYFNKKKYQTVLDNIEAEQVAGKAADEDVMRLG